MMMVVMTMTMMMMMVMMMMMMMMMMMTMMTMTIMMMMMMMMMMTMTMTTTMMMMMILIHPHHQFQHHYHRLDRYRQPESTDPPGGVRWRFGGWVVLITEESFDFDAYFWNCLSLNLMASRPLGLVGGLVYPFHSRRSSTL